MKKRIALMLVLMLMLPVFASAVPVGYPDVIEGLDFGGQTVYVYDWWSRDDEQHSYRSQDPNEETQKLYDYRDWLEQTYHVTIVETALGDWATNPEILAEKVENQDNSELCLIAIASEFAGAPLANGMLASWKIDLSGDKWNKADSEFMTKRGKVYGVYPEKSEPRSILFFNKRVLLEAGIDPQDIYDAQKNGSWTWEMLDSILDKVQRDQDNDGVNDIWGLTGSGDDFTLGMMASNDASFFDYDETGKLVITADRPEALQALTERQYFWGNYAAPTPEDANWDWFKDYWKQGTSAFYAGQSYEGFNDYAVMADMADEWGAVMFPMGPNAKTYKAYVNDNVYTIPNVYDEETAKKIQQIFDLYTNDTPGVDSSTSWIGNKYNYTDDRAVDETYAMMREDEHEAANMTNLLGSTNTVLGSSLLWGPINEMSAAEAVEQAKPGWQALLDQFNAEQDLDKVRDKVEGFVERCYNIILGREAEEKGLAGWVDLLATGTMNASQMVTSFTQSTEFNNRGLENGETVDILYNTMLNRPADEGGKAGWTGVLDSGYSTNVVVSGFCGSAEFAAICAEYGIEPGTVELEARDQNLGVTGFVKRCYQEALQRESDVGGLNSWCSMLLDHTMTPKEVAYGFVFSPEMINRNLNNVEKVLTMYRLYMGREPQNGEENGWVGLLDGGMSMEDLNNGFANSQEFDNIVKSYGL